jgi:hypothetical protein
MPMLRKPFVLGLFLSTLVIGCSGGAKTEQESSGNPNAPGGGANDPEPPIAGPSSSETIVRDPNRAEVSLGRKPLHTSPIPRSEVEIVWRDGDLSGSVRNGSESLYAKLENNTGSEQRGELFLEAAGLDGQTVKRRLGAFRLAEHETREVSVSVQNLPIQSEVASTFVAIMAEHHRNDGAVLISSTAPLYYYFRNGYRDAIFYDENDVATKVDSKVLERDDMLIEGRILQEDGSWLAAADSSLQQAAADSRQGLSALRLVRTDQLPERKRTPPVAPASSKESSDLHASPLSEICTNWRAFYRDSGNAGEDHLRTIGWHAEPAKYAFAQLVNPSNGFLLFEGNLDERGCAHVPALSPGSYRLIQYTDMQGWTGPTFNTFMRMPDGFIFVASISTAFTINVEGGSATLSPTQFNAATNAASIAGQALYSQNQQAGLGMPSGEYRIVANQGCEALTPPTDACFMPCHQMSGGGCHPGTNEVRTGTTSINGYHGAFWKGMLGHEIGHMVQARAMGSPFADLDLDEPAEPLCRCDHYDTSWGNRHHCMQSREEQGGAQREGFAHAFAARMLNRTEQANAIFPYYKPVKFFATTNTIFPPVNMNLWSGSGTGPWMFNKCPAAGRGVEWDWMIFFYRVASESSINYTTFNDLFNIYKRACTGGAGSCSDQQVNWANLLSAAQAYYGGSTTNPKYTRFRDMGVSGGVAF